MHLRESVYGLSTYSYVCTVADEDRRTGAREGEMHHGPPPVLVQPPSLSLSLSLFLLDVFSEHNKQTPPRNLFSYVRGICQSTPLSPPSGSRSSFFLFGFFHFLTFDSGARAPPNRPHITSRWNGNVFFSGTPTSDHRQWRIIKRLGESLGTENRRWRRLFDGDWTFGTLRV